MLDHGFQGMEARLPLLEPDPREFAAFLAANRLSYISAVFTAYDVLPAQGASVAKHLADLEQKLPLAGELSPRVVNILEGNDRWPVAQQMEFFSHAMALAFHQQNWEAVWRSQQARGYEVSTLTAEFGADGYLHHLPFNHVPVADLWSRNTWMARTEREHFNRFCPLPQP